MYKNILGLINITILHHNSLENIDGITERDKFMFIQGLKVVKDLIEDHEEFVKTELAYETFGDVVKALSNNLEKEHMIQIVKDVFKEKE